MYNNPYVSPYNPQPTLDRINTQINELEKMKSQMQQPVQAPPTNLTQNFQLAPTNREVIKYANSMEEVQRDIVIGDTPYFSKDMSVLWVKTAPNSIKAYELREIINKDGKDLKIEFLMAQIEDLKKGMVENAKSDNVNVDESVKNEESSNASNGGKSKSKSK